MTVSWFKKKKTPPADEPLPPAAGDAPVAPLTAAAPGDAPRTGFLERLKERLSKTRQNLGNGLERIFAGKRGLDEELLEDLEELLITSDLGVETAMDLIQRIGRKASRVSDAEALKAVLKEEILALLPAPQPERPEAEAKPHVIMVVGVNGVGKTTTIGKLAARYGRAGQKVLIAAADTFRAAATEQLAIWAQRAGAELVRHKDGADPAAVAYDSIEAALARGSDIVIVDTAGRLHTKVNLMEELKKIKRTIAKKLPDAPHEILLVLDATTGQNAIAQADMFHEAVGITGVALTKLDGTAKGGIVVSICGGKNLPLRYIGIGEQIEDLQDFDPRQFVQALF
jgi:fused signal recognition particle receptor